MRNFVLEGSRLETPGGSLRFCGGMCFICGRGICASAGYA